MEYMFIFVITVFIALWGISIYMVKTGRLTANEWSMRSLGLPQGSVGALNPVYFDFLHHDGDENTRPPGLACRHSGDCYRVLLWSCYGAESSQSTDEVRLASHPSLAFFWSS